MNMDALVNDISKSSPLAAFLFPRLEENTYPNCLFWEKKENFSACLKCIRKSKEGHIDEAEKIYEDYASFSKKISSTKPRCAFLQAIKKSPYVDLDKKRSSHDEKYFTLNEKFNSLLDKHFQRTRGELGFQLNSYDAPSTSGMMNYTTQEVSLEMPPSVPDIDMEINHCFDGSSFYPEVDFQANGNSNESGNPESMELQEEFPANADTDMEEPTLPASEESFSLNFDQSYNSAEVFPQSWMRNQNVMDASLIGAERTFYEIQDVCSVEISDNVVRKIQDVEPNSSTSQKLYLCTVEKRSSY